jgi:hypothetical protein
MGALTRGQVLKYHPLAELFPLLDGEEFDALVEDIRVHRLHEAIVLHDGKILDGRNRYCEQARCRQAAYRKRKRVTASPSNTPAEPPPVTGSPTRGRPSRNTGMMQMSNDDDVDECPCAICGGSGMSEDYDAELADDIGWLEQFETNNKPGEIEGD